MARLPWLVVPWKVLGTALLGWPGVTMASPLAAADAMAKKASQRAWRRGAVWVMTVFLAG
jgi:hypothetical protein